MKRFFIRKRTALIFSAMFLLASIISILELKDDIIKYIPEDLKDNEDIKTIIQIISSNYQNNEIEFKDK